MQTSFCKTSSFLPRRATAAQHMLLFPRLYHRLKDVPGVQDHPKFASVQDVTPLLFSCALQTNEAKRPEVCQPPRSSAVQHQKKVFHSLLVAHQSSICGEALEACPPGCSRGLVGRVHMLLKNI